MRSALSRRLYGRMENPKKNYRLKKLSDSKCNGGKHVYSGGRPCTEKGRSADTSDPKSCAKGMLLGMPLGRPRKIWEDRW